MTDKIEAIPAQKILLDGMLGARRVFSCETPTAEIVQPYGTVAALQARIAELEGALQYLADECDEDIDLDYNPHAAPLALARQALSKENG